MRKSIPDIFQKGISVILMFLLVATGAICWTSCSCEQHQPVIANLYINPQVADILQEIIIRVDVRNFSRNDNRFNIKLEIKGNDRGSKEISVAGNGVEMCYFTVNESLAGKYPVEVIYEYKEGTQTLSDKLSGQYIVNGAGTSTSSSTTTTSSTTASTHAQTIGSTTTMPSYTPTTQPVSTIVPTHVFIPDIAGHWHWDLTVTVANGACAGEEGPQPTYTVQITQDGDVVTISGFLASNPSTSISGNIALDNTIDKWVVTFSGSYAEDEGTTTTNYRLVLNNTYDTMTGDEAWSWALGNLTCKDCKSTVVANKLP